MAVSWYAARYRMIGVLVAIISALFMTGTCAVQATSLYSLTPLNTPVTVSVDAPWVWNTTADIRKAMNESHCNESLFADLSFEHDMLPWVGQAGLFLTDFDGEMPSLAILLQIRDADHMISADRIETFLADGEKVQWKSLDYKGISIRRYETLSDNSVVKVATATVDGWLVITVGDGVIRQVIDTYRGDIPSLTTHPSFTKATNGLPTTAVGQFMVNGQAILALMQQHDAEMARGMQNTEMGKFFVSGALSVPDDTLQLDTVYCTSSASTQTVLKQLRTDVGTVSGNSLSQLPQGTFAALLINKPDKWVVAMEQLIENSCSDPKELASVRQSFSQIDGLRDVLQRCAGELGIGVSWMPGKGFGLAMAGEASTDENARTAAENLSSFIQHMDEKVEKSNDLYTLPVTKDAGVLLCWLARKQWLVGATHPDWLTPSTPTPALTIPAGVNDAHLIAFGDYSFLPQVLRNTGMMKSNAITKLSNTDLKQWMYSVKFDEDGSAIRCHVSSGLPVTTVTGMIAQAFERPTGKEAVQASLDNLNELVWAETAWSMENNDRLPNIKTSADIKKILDVSERSLYSPRTDERYAVNPLLAGKKLGSFKYPGRIVIFYERTPGRDGTRCVAFLDGHVAVIPAAKWAIVKQRSYLP